MATCSHCSAPLPANTNRCTYCGTRNDVDLHARHAYSIDKMVSKRICPHCATALQTIRLSSDEALFIERCETCFGLFFDRQELDAILHSSVSHVFDINTMHIDNINKDRYRVPQKVRYIKCPECRMLMDRVNFGQRSGVVVDQCKIHGVWLDSGELTHLLEWKKAGGHLLHERTAALEKQRKKKRASVPYSADPYRSDSIGGFESGLEFDLLETVASVIFKLFD